MRFNLTKPCSNCPFLKIDKTKGWLRENRIIQITEDILYNNKTFTCHKTLSKPEREQSHCYGALVMIDNYEADNNMLRIAGRLGLYDGQPAIDENVFKTVDDMLEWHEGI